MCNFFEFSLAPSDFYLCSDWTFNTLLSVLRYSIESALCREVAMILCNVRFSVKFR